MNNTELKTGTTTVGIICKDCVVLAADMRATAGNMVVHMGVQKIEQVHEHMALTVAGSVSEIQMMTRYLRANLRIKELHTDSQALVREGAHMLASYVYNQARSVGAMAHFLMGGYDVVEGFSLYDIFVGGSITKIDDKIASGSGMLYAYGVLDGEYKPDMTQQQGIDLALRAVNAALRRDVATGNGVNIYVINKDGVKRVMSKHIETTV